MVQMIRLLNGGITDKATLYIVKAKEAETAKPVLLQDQDDVESENPMNQFMARVRNCFILA